jgi:AraC family transcriptional regulator, transcriptional activator of pobA
MNGCATYNFFKTKYGSELLIDLIRLETLENYIRRDPKHCLTYFDITFIIEGEGRFLIDGNEFTIGSGQLFFTAPNQIREWKIDSMPKGLVLIFEEEFICNFFNDVQFVKKLSFFTPSLHNPNLTLTEEQGQYFENILIQIENEISSKKDNHLLRALLYQALAWLNSAYRSSYQFPEVSVIDNRAMQFSQLVEQHFIEKHSVSFYAGELCVTPGHLNDLIKKQYAISAKKYLQNRLIIEAKRLLLYSDKPVSEIAWQLNFQDSAYFIRLFRKETGISPLAFRKKQNP